MDDNAIPIDRTLVAKPEPTTEEPSSAAQTVPPAADAGDTGALLPSDAPTAQESETDAQAPDARTFTAVEGGNPPLTNAEVCESACAQTDPIALPQALCEDWNLEPTRSPPYEYCNQSTGAESCQVRCELGLAAASALCLAALAPAMECVAATGFYASFASEVNGCVLSECTAELLGMASECSGLRSQFETAQALWSDAGLVAYQYSYGDRTIQVRDDEARVIAGEPLENPPSIADLFAQIASSLDSADVVPYASYDATIGYPNRIVTYSLYSDSEPPICPTSTEQLITDLVEE